VVVRRAIRAQQQRYGPDQPLAADDADLDLAT